jgi:lysosomal alpha-mannosidase
LKRKIREVESIYRSSNFILSLSLLHDKYSNNSKLLESLKWMNILEKAVSDTTHHDAITGTSKKRVNDECYFPILEEGLNIGQNIVQFSLESLTGGSNLTFNYLSTFQSLKEGEFLELIIYNSLSWNRTDFIVLELLEDQFCFFDSIGNSIQIQTQMNPFSNLFDIHFQIEIPALGFISIQSKRCNHQNTHHFIKKNSTFTVSNEFFDLTFNQNLSFVFDKKKNKKMNISQDFFQYSVNRGGKYIFVPSSDKTIIKPPPPNLIQSFIIEGPLVTIVHQKFEYFVEQIIKIYKKKNYFEFDIKIGHEVGIPSNSEIGTIFRNAASQNNKFYTDSNGLEMHEREPNVRNHLKFNHSAFKF